jgi:hypothetical protein
VKAGRGQRCPLDQGGGFLANQAGRWAGLEAERLLSVGCPHCPRLYSMPTQVPGFAAGYVGPVRATCSSIFGKARSSSGGSGATVTCDALQAGIVASAGVAHAIAGSPEWQGIVAAAADSTARAAAQRLRRLEATSIDPSLAEPLTTHLRDGEPVTTTAISAVAVDVGSVNRDISGGYTSRQPGANGASSTRLLQLLGRQWTSGEPSSDSEPTPRSRDMAARGTADSSDATTVALEVEIPAQSVSASASAGTPNAARGAASQLTHWQRQQHRIEQLLQQTQSARSLMALAGVATVAPSAEEGVRPAAAASPPRPSQPATTAASSPRPSQPAAAASPPRPARGTG